MTEDEAYTLALSPLYRLVDAEKVCGLTHRQILHVGQKAQLKDWNPGAGYVRRLSLCELFQLSLLAAMDKRVPAKFLPHLAEGAGFYLHRCLTSASFRKKAAVVAAYPDAKGSWWFLLIHDGKLPTAPPEPVSIDMLIIVPVKDVLSRLLLGVREHFGLDLDWSPEELRADLAKDLAVVAAALSTRQWTVQ